MKIKAALLGVTFGILSGLWLSGCGSATYRSGSYQLPGATCILEYENLEEVNRYWLRGDLWLNCPGLHRALVKESVEFHVLPEDSVELVHLVRTPRPLPSIPVEVSNDQP
jgi:hypothetical protein